MNLDNLGTIVVMEKKSGNLFLLDKCPIGILIGDGDDSKNRIIGYGEEASEYLQERFTVIGYLDPDIIEDYGDDV